MAGHSRTACGFAAILAVLCAPALADMVPVEAPVSVPKAAAAATPAPASQEPEAMAPEADPLMVVRFKKDQRYNYFERSLRTAVDATEKKAAGAFYDVVSYVPANAGSSRSSIMRQNERSAERLQAVVTEMQRNGIDPSRIRYRTQQAESGDGQEIKIFVNPQ